MEIVNSFAIKSQSEKGTLQLFREIIELTRDAVLVIDELGLVVHANSAALRIFQYTFDELFGQNIKVRVLLAR